MSGRNRRNNDRTKLRMDNYSSDRDRPRAGGRCELDTVIKKARRDRDPSQNTFWAKKVLEAEEKEPNRWRHSGFKELYVENGSKEGNVTRRRRSSERDNSRPRFNRLQSSSAKRAINRISPNRRPNPVRERKLVAERERSPVRRIRSPQIVRRAIKTARNSPLNREQSPPRRRDTFVDRNNTRRRSPVTRVRPRSPVPPRIRPIRSRSPVQTRSPIRARSPVQRGLSRRQSRSVENHERYKFARDKKSHSSVRQIRRSRSRSPLRQSVRRSSSGELVTRRRRQRSTSSESFRRHQVTKESSASSSVCSDPGCNICLAEAAAAQSGKKASFRSSMSPPLARSSSSPLTRSPSSPEVIDVEQHYPGSRKRRYSESPPVRRSPVRHLSPMARPINPLTSVKPINPSTSDRRQPAPIISTRRHELLQSPIVIEDDTQPPADHKEHRQRSPVMEPKSRSKSPVLKTNISTFRLPSPPVSPHVGAASPPERPKEKKEKKKKKKKSKKRTKEKQKDGSSQFISTVVHKIKQEEMSDNSDITPQTKPLTLSERFGKMAQRSMEYEPHRTVAPPLAPPAPPPIPPPYPRLDDRSSPEPPPQLTARVPLRFSPPPGLVMDGSWNDVAVRYAYYKEQGYLQDLSFKDYLKWEEWWYKYQRYLDEERKLERLRALKMLPLRM